MLIFRYYKKLGAEYISHLDVLRHVRKTLIRAKIPVEYSQGFHPHMLIYLSPPVFVGLKTESEYCLVETPTPAAEFKDRFNAYAVKGIKCMLAFDVAKKHKIAGLIDSAEYVIKGVPHFDAQTLLQDGGVEITDKQGALRDVHDKVYDARFCGDDLIVRLAFGNDVLRADAFCTFLEQKFNCKTVAEKTQAFIGGRLPEECLE